jgi:hypothetical protein
MLRSAQRWPESPANGYQAYAHCKACGTRIHVKDTLCDTCGVLASRTVYGVGLYVSHDGEPLRLVMSGAHPEYFETLLDAKIEILKINIAADQPTRYVPVKLEFSIAD